MNVEHFRAFLWLRWRLLVNRLKKSGMANTILLGIAAGLAVVTALGVFAGGFTLGVLVLPRASADVLLYVWDGVVIAFTFGWAISVLTDLQRSEPVSLDKFLHLPVTLSSAFFLNYVSSLFSLVLLIFVPACLGLIVGLTVAEGPALLVGLPLIVAFVFMITAVTYQFQGWIASMMTNPRRRRTVIAVVTVLFILLAQLPNLLINVVQPGWKHAAKNKESMQLAIEHDQLDKQHSAGQISDEEYGQRLKEIKAAEKKQDDVLLKQNFQHIGEQAAVVNVVVPIGWLPFGVMAAAGGNVLPGLLGTLGLASIGAVCLWRSYRTTLRIYTGVYTVGKKPGVAAAPGAASPIAARLSPVRSAPATQAAHGTLLEKRLPLVSEQASAIATATFRSLLRAPEAKMLLLTPFIMVIVFAGIYFRASSKQIPVEVGKEIQQVGAGGALGIPAALRPVMAFGGMAMILLTMLHLVGNQFGFDRTGFRVFVLCPAPRRDILIGKNLAVAPFALAFGLFIAAAIEVVLPMEIDYLLALVPQFIAMYFAFCVLANWLSIYNPLPVRAGSMKPTNVKIVPALWQFLFTIILYPLTMVPLLAPVGARFLYVQLGYPSFVPICLMLSLAECAGVLLIYWLVVGVEGSLLQAREQTILTVVTAPTSG